MKDDIKFSQQYIVRTLRDEEVVPVVKGDWERLKRLVNRIIPHTRIFQILYSVAFSFCGNAVYTLIALNSSAGVPAWASFITWVSFFVGGIAGLLCLRMDYLQKEPIKSSVDSILEEIVLIEEKCSSSKKEGGSV